MKLQYIFIALLLVTTACQKDEAPRPQPKQGYPTTYKPLSSVKWEARNNAFQQINSCDGLGLNEYGFVEGEIPLNGADTLTEEFIISTVKSLFDHYFRFLGLPEDFEIKYKEQLRINTPYMVPYGSDNIESFFRIWEEFGNTEAWKHDLEKIDFNFFISQIFIENKRFLGPDIHVHFKLEERKIVLSDNWFPKVFVPSSEIYSKDDAVFIAYKKILKQSGDDIWEIKHNFGSVKIFTMLNTIDGIEIRECWRMSLINQSFYYTVFVDTQTGEILQYRKSNVHI